MDGAMRDRMVMIKVSSEKNIQLKIPPHKIYK